MPVTHRAKRLWFYLNKPVKPSKHTAFTPIQRRARSIMSVASLFIFFAGGWWLLIALCSWEIAYLPSTSDGLAARALLEHWHLLPMELLNAHLIALAWLLGFSATVAPLVFLRRLGKTLYLQAPLSFAVARRFRWLGHALGASIILRFTAGWLAASQLAEYQIKFGSGFWATLTAAMVAYVVADLVRDGAQAAEENREFV